ncbi:MAG: hypothetical protein LC785_11855 [Acidobacteria bacterium]|nr:hypothetical protein [Acidobacteriota bacterium]
MAWHLDSPRVSRKIDASSDADETARDALERATPLVRLGADGRPEACGLAKDVRGGLVSIEIPDDINTLNDQNVNVALAWRAATRIAFLGAFSEGYIAEEFFRIEREGRRCGAYLLRRASGERRND